MPPDFDSGKGYYWMKQTRAAIAAGTRDTLPRVPQNPTVGIDHFTRTARRQLARTSFSQAVEQRLTRRSFTIGISFDSSGRRVS